MRVAAVKRFRAWLMLATFVATLGTAGLGLDHQGVIDTACGAFALSTTSDGAQLANPSGTGPQHCPICHFLRAVSGASIATQARLAVQDGLPLEFTVTSQIPPAVDLITRPSRGPPASPLTFVI